MSNTDNQRVYPFPNAGPPTPICNIHECKTEHRPELDHDGKEAYYCPDGDHYYLLVVERVEEYRSNKEKH